MTIKRSEYTVVGAKEDVVYHFATDQNVVRVLDANNKLVGTLNEFAFEGKVVTSGSFKSLNISGLYKVKGLTDMPSGITADKMCILSIKAVGKIGNPEFVAYTLIGSNGEIYNCTAIGSKFSPWTKGGTTLENTIKGITNSIGEISKLTTDKKANLVETINDIDKSLKAAKSNQTAHEKSFEEYKTHNHDDRYLKKDGGVTTGDIQIGVGKGINVIGSDGKPVKIVTSTKNGFATIGSKGIVIDIESKGDLTHNGKKIWTESNDGVGSGLDADKLGGVAHDKFLRSDIINRVSADFKLQNGKSYYIDESKSKAGGALYWRSFEGYERGRIMFDSTNRMDILQGGKRSLTMSKEGITETFRHHVFTSQGDQVGIVLRLDSSDKGMQIYRNRSSKYLGIYDNVAEKRIAYASDVDQKVRFDKSIGISGRMLHLQSSTPSGSHSVGDIWIG